MDFLKKTIILTLCFVMLESVPFDRWTCDRIQYVEFGERGTISCLFPSDYQGVYWYDSADITADLIIRREKQDDGNFITAGMGHLNGSYEIEPGGSLVITNVSNIHDRVFSVSLIDDNKTIYNFEIEVVTVYNGGQRHPHLSVCPTSNICLTTFKEAGELHCSYNNARPAVMLSWDVTALRDAVDVKTTNSSDGSFTFSSYSSFKVSNSTLKPLVAITCRANGPALNFHTEESTAVVDFTEKSTEVIFKMVDIHTTYAQTNTRVEVECAREETKASSLLWKLGGINSSQILMFLSNGQMKEKISINSTLIFTEKGTLIFPRININQDGMYTCVYTDGDEYYSHTYTVVVTVVPSPPAVVAVGCVWNASDCVFLLSNTVSRKITCMVSGAHPMVDVTMTVANSTGLTIANQNYNIAKRGNVFDIAVEADIHIQEKSQCSHDVYCLATGPGTNLFRSSRKITLIIEPCDNKVTYIIIVAVTVGFVFVVLAAAFVKFRRARRSKRNLSTSVLEELADTLTYWPLGQLRNTAIFEEKVISFLRNVSDEVEKNRKKEDKRVIGGAAVGIAGGAMAIAAPIFPPLAVTLLVGGAVVGAVGAGVNIAASWDKLRTDKAKSKSVQEPLQNFLLIQKEIAETIALLDFAYKAIRDVHMDSCLKESHREQIVNIMNKAKSKQKSNLPLQDQFSHIHSFTLELLTIITEVLSNESSMLVVSTEWKTKMKEAMSLPFQHLHESIKYLVYNEKRNTRVTFLMFVKLLYHPGQGLSNGDNKVGVRCTRQAKGNMQAEIVQGGLLATRAAVNVVDVGEDLVEIGNSVFRIARGVSVAGVLLSTLGIVVDVAFLGSAIFDLQKSDKGKLATALSEVADTMEIMNNIVKELAQERRCQICCCK